ncbi:hypothetical protein BDW22DRAFT_1359314 [Trametopsis cervina]|nr:hypothetical protein BDW22DRAFT_1359314 [Trametopsis cervina]
MGYSLWLVPAQQERTALEQFMKYRPMTYREKHGSRSYPRLDPHITLATFKARHCPSIDSILPQDIVETPVTFQALRAGDNYMGAMSITIAKNRRLMKLHDGIIFLLEKVEKLETKSRRFPHMSLFYVDEDEERKRLEKDLARSGNVRNLSGGKGVVLTCSVDNGAKVQLAGFNGQEIWLVDCNSSVVEEWEVKEKRLLVSQHANTQGGLSKHGDEKKNLPLPHNSTPDTLILEHPAVPIQSDKQHHHEVQYSDTPSQFQPSLESEAATVLPAQTVKDFPLRVSSQRRSTSTVDEATTDVRHGRGGQDTTAQSSASTQLQGAGPSNTSKKAIGSSLRELPKLGKQQRKGKKK